MITPLLFLMGTASILHGCTQSQAAVYGGPRSGAGTSCTRGWQREALLTWSDDATTDLKVEASPWTDSRGVAWTLAAHVASVDTASIGAGGLTFSDAGGADLTPVIYADVADLVALGGGDAYDPILDWVWIYTHAESVSNTGSSNSGAWVRVSLDTQPTNKALGSLYMYRNATDTANVWRQQVDSTSSEVARSVTEGYLSFDWIATYAHGRWQDTADVAPTQPSDVDDAFSATHDVMSPLIIDSTGGTLTGATPYYQMALTARSGAGSYAVTYTTTEVLRYRCP